MIARNGSSLIGKTDVPGVGTYNINRAL